MNINPLLWPTMVLGALLFCAAYAWARRSRPIGLQIAAAVMGGILAVPGMLYALYYLHLFDNAVWFYELRAAPLTELLGAGLGLLGGFAAARSARLRRWDGVLRAVIIGGVLVLLLVPYMKSFVLPLDLDKIEDRWSEGVCLQSTPASCGPACAATLLRTFGLRVTERRIAQECYTCATGTENWYMARALRRRGLPVTFVVDNPRTSELRYPAIAGVRLGERGPGHFIAVLDRTDSGYVIGEPLGGPLIMNAEESLSRYYFTGFFMVVGE